ncbi:MAG: O-antigen ligase family protein [Acidobacteria bacterium]|nr:O-antigen ligase family protein [Acidobacteriota bacterium]
MQTFLCRENAPALAAGGALALSVVSIAGSQILLGLSIVLTIRQWRTAAYPRGAYLLVLFAALTVAAVLAAPSPAAGFPQIKKFFVYLIVPCIAVAYSGPGFARGVFAGIGAGGGLSAVWGFIQYARKYNAADTAGVPFTQFYIDNRITGFMSHWMTFGGTMMCVSLLASAYVLFHRPVRWRIAALALLAAVAINLAWTRGILIGTLAGGLYLIFRWRPAFVLATPVLAIGAFFALPEAEKARIVSIVRPRGELDSNSHRVALFFTGVEMIKGNPLLGVGPEHIKYEFERYAPESVPRPVPRHWYIGHLHNVYVQFAADRGIPAMLAIIGFLIWNLWTIALARGDAGTRWMLHGVAAFLAGVLVAGVFEHNLADSEILTLTLGMLTIGARLAYDSSTTTAITNPDV